MLTNPHRFLNVKVVVAAFNQEKALVGAFLRDCENFAKLKLT